MDLRGDKKEIAKALEQGTLQGASGGSVKDKKDTSAWVVESKTHQKHSDHIIRGAGPIGVDQEFLYSTGAESSAFLAPLYVAWSLAEEYNLEKGKIIMHIDNTSLYLDGDPPQQGERSLRHLRGDHDLMQMKKLWDESLEQRNIEVKCNHVKAHQDKEKN